MSAKKRIIDDNYLQYVFYLTLPLLLFPPFFRGLFFDYEFSIARIYAGLVLAAYVFIRRDHIRLSRNIMDYAWIGLITAYILSNFTAFNQRAALEHTLRVFTFAGIFWLLAQTITNLKQFKTALSVMYAAGIGVALAGLGTAFGTFSFYGAFNENLILSTLQYHNAAAIFMVATGIIGLFLAAYYESIWWRIAAGGLNYIILSTAYGAGSRGAILVAPIGFLLLIIGMPKGYRLKVFLNFIAVLLPFLVTAKQVLDFGVHSEGFYWGWLLLGTVLACGAQFVVEKFLSVSEQTQRRVVAAAGIVVTVIGIGLILFMGSSIMPASIADRLSNISFEQQSVQERFYFYKDAFKIIQESPVFGVGGGGWNSTYPKYQSYLYFSTEVHNHFLQVWVEAGIVGFIFYILLWVGLLVTIIKIMLKTESPEYRSIAWVSTVAAISIMLHSAIDFSLSLGAVAILMWGLAGVVRAIERVSLEEAGVQAKPLAGPVVRKVVGLVLAGVLFIVSSSLYLAAVKEKEAITAYNGGNIQGALNTFEDARGYDPLNSNYAMYLASLYGNLAYQRQDAALIQTAIEQAEKAVRLNENSVQPLWTLAEAYLMGQRSADAVTTAEQALNAAPLKQEGYDSLARIYLAAAKVFVQQGQKENARVTAGKVSQIPQMIEENLARVAPEARRYWVRAPFPTVSESIKKVTEEADNLVKTL